MTPSDGAQSALSVVRLETAIEKALEELGVPQPGYPAPVANAVDILGAALEGLRGLREEVDKLRSATTWETCDVCCRERPIVDMEQTSMGTKAWICWECQE